MKSSIFSVVTIYILFFFGSTTAFAESIIPCGWGVMNLHEKNPNLIGFATKQYPEDKNPNYTDSHPYLVVFIFKTGPAHFVFYSPSGQVLGGEWDNIDEDNWAIKQKQGVEKLYHECRGSNLEYKPNKQRQ